MVNWYGQSMATFICVIIPIWMIGWKIIPLHQKILFSAVGMGVVFYAVEFGGFRRKN